VDKQLQENIKRGKEKKAELVKLAASLVSLKAQISNNATAINAANAQLTKISKELVKQKAIVENAKKSKEELQAKVDELSKSKDEKQKNAGTLVINRDKLALEKQQGSKALDKLAEQRKKKTTSRPNRCSKTSARPKGKLR